MTDQRPADGFQVGNRVRLIGGPYVGATGQLWIYSPNRLRVGIDLDTPITRATGERDTTITAKKEWLERIDATEMDEPVPADPAMPEGIPGSSVGDICSGGPTPEYPEQAETFVRGDVATLREHAEAIADLTRRFDALELSHNFLLRGFLELRDEIRNPPPN